MGLFRKIWRNRWIIRAIIPSLIFNLRYLPFYQAIRIPIILYKGRILEMSGKITIKSPIKFGMIKLGVDTVSLFPNNGITLENRGELIFNGSTLIGNNSAISLGTTGLLEFGKNFTATTRLKIACYHSILFEKNILIGWNAQIVDSDFHSLKNIKLGGGSKGFGSIRIGHDVWIANGCKIYKNVSIPHSCVIGADTILYKPVECSPYSFIVNDTTTIVKTTGIYRDRNDDKINYEKYEA